MALGVDLLCVYVVSMYIRVILISFFAGLAQMAIRVSA